MRRLHCALLATVAVAGLGSHASAAPAYTWTGFYVGASAGYVSGNSDPSLIGLVTVPPFDFAGTNGLPPGLNPRGFIGGGLAGYNWQSGQWLFGGEIDISGLDAKADASVSPFF